MKIVVTGANGQLGTDVMARLKEKGIEAIGADISDFDITDGEQTLSFFLKKKPDAVIHCAAYTAVDKAESEPELCEKVNAVGSKNIAEASKAVGAKCLYISTDYVFGGSGEEPYEVDSPKAPVNRYGETKLAGENAVKQNNDKYFIVRTSWVFGLNGANFVKTMLRLGAQREEVAVVNDQIGSPTFTEDLAALLCDMIVTEKYGEYHASNEGFCSWAEFAAEIMKLAGNGCRVRGISSDEYKSAAARPKNSRLSKASLDNAGFDRLPGWQNALQRYFEKSKQN